MSSTHDSSSQDRLLNDIVAAYLQSVDKGMPLDRQELLSKHPAQADALREFFRDHDRMKKAAAPVPSSEAPTLAPNEVVSPVAPLDTVRYFGDYELIEEIARGGMGVVYRARQKSLNRLVALKMILAGQFASAQDVTRFHTEAEAAANLDHPNIVPIYEVGRHQDQHYFSMKLIEGGSLAQHMPRLRGDTRAAVRLLTAVARAVHYAHQHGIMHRDLKPANILVSSEFGIRGPEFKKSDSPQSNSGFRTPNSELKPHVTDFGLAKRVEGGSNVTQSGVIVGTPSYMAPEQARGEKGVSTAVDVYSLGAILYEVLTGQPPFRASSPLDMIMQVLDREPDHPRRLNAAVDNDLATISLKCLEKDAGRRYESAAALADELERWQRGEPIAARPTGRAERAWRWCRRNPAVAGLAAAVALAILAGSIVSISFAFLADYRAKQSDRNAADARAAEMRAGVNALAAEQETARTREANGMLDRSLFVANMDLTQVAIGEGNYEQALELLDATRPKTGKDDLRGWEWDFWQRCCHSELRTLKPTTPSKARGGMGACLAFSADGQRLASGYWDVESGPVVVVWDMATGKEVLTLDTENTGVRLVQSMTFSPDGRRLSAFVDLGDLKEWDATTGQLLNVRRNESMGSFSPDGRLRASHSYGPGFFFSEPFMKRVRPDRADSWYRPALDARIDLPLLAASTVGFLGAPQGSGLAALAILPPREMPITTIREMATGRVLRMFPGHRYGPTFSPDGSRLAMTYGPPEIWDITTGRKLWELSGVDWTPQLAFSANGKYLAVVMRPGVMIFDAATGKELWGQLFPAVDVAFCPESRLLAAACTDGIVRVLDAATGQAVTECYGHQGGVRAVAFSPDGWRLASIGEDNTVRLWSPFAKGPHDRMPVRSLRQFGLGGGAIAFVPSGGGIVTSSAPSSQGIYELDRGPKDGVIRLQGANVAIHLWDPATGHTRRTFRFPSEQSDEPRSAGTIAVRPGGRQIAAASPAGQVFVVTDGPPQSMVYPAEIKIWDADRGKLLHALKHTPKPLSPPGFTCLAYRPDGQQLATADIEGTVRIWNADTGRELHTFGVVPADVQQSFFIRHLAYSPDGNRLALAGAILYAVPDRREALTVRIWDAQTGAELHRLYGHTDSITHVVFSPDAKWLVSASADRTVKVWDAKTGAAVQTLKGHRQAPSSIAFSPDSKRLVSASGDGPIVLWDVKTWQSVARLSLPGVDQVAFTPDGGQLVATSKDGVHIWDGRPLTSEIQAEREARALAEPLFNRLLCRAERIAWLRGERTISEPVRKIAMTWAEVWPEDPGKLASAANALIWQPGATPEQYQRALLWAEASCRLAGEDAGCLTNLAMARYRVGQYDKALEAMNRVAELDKEDYTFRLGVRAMTQFRLGMKPEARQTLERFRKLLELPQRKNEESLALYREALQLIERQPKPEK